MSKLRPDAQTLIHQVGSRLRALRLHRGWTLERTAEQLGMAVQNYARIEKGQNLTIETLARLAGLFGVQAHELLLAVPVPHVWAGLVRAGWRPVTGDDAEAFGALAVLDLLASDGCSVQSSTAVIAGWAVPPPHRRTPNEGRFLAQLPNRSWCLFAAPVLPPLLGKTLLLRASVLDGTAGGYSLCKVFGMEVDNDTGIVVRLDAIAPETAQYWVRLPSEAQLCAEAELVEVVAEP